MAETAEPTWDLLPARFSKFCVPVACPRRAGRWGLPSPRSAVTSRCWKRPCMASRCSRAPDPGFSPRKLARELRPHAESDGGCGRCAAEGRFGRRGGDEGAVRITASEIIGTEVLPPILTDFRARHAGRDRGAIALRIRVRICCGGTRTSPCAWCVPRRRRWCATNRQDRTRLARFTAVSGDARRAACSSPSCSSITRSSGFDQPALGRTRPEAADPAHARAVCATAAIATLGNWRRFAPASASAYASTAWPRAQPGAGLDPAARAAYRARHLDRHARSATQRRAHPGDVRSPGDELRPVRGALRRPAARSVTRRVSITP